VINSQTFSLFHLSFGCSVAMVIILPIPCSQKITSTYEFIFGTNWGCRRETWTLNGQYIILLLTFAQHLRWIWHVENFSKMEKSIRSVHSKKTQPEGSKVWICVILYRSKLKGTGKTAWLDMEKENEDSC